MPANTGTGLFFFLQTEINLKLTDQIKLPATHNLLMTVPVMSEIYNHNQYLPKNYLITSSESLFNINHSCRLRNMIQISQGVIQVD